MANASLIDTIRRGTIFDVRALIEAGANVNDTNSSGATPLHAAAGKADADLTALLLSKGAAVNARDSYGHTPLHDLCGSLQPPEMVCRVAEILLAGGASLSTKQQQGRTPIEEARYQGHHYLMDVFARYGAELKVSTASVKAITERLRSAGHPQLTEMEVRDEVERLLLGEQRMLELGRLVRSELVKEGVLKPEPARSGPGLPPSTPFLSAGIQCSSTEAAILAGILTRHGDPSKVSLETVHQSVSKMAAFDNEARNLKFKIEAVLASGPAGGASDAGKGRPPSGEAPAGVKRPWWRFW
jgi:hypothetical protein